MNTATIAAATRYPVGLIRPLTLRDGRRVLLRPVLPQDESTEQAFVMALSPASRYRRFHVGLRALPPSLLRQLTQVDHEAHVALVAQPEAGDGRDEDGDPGIVADARYVRGPQGTAEFAVAVADGWQQQGLGRQMLGQLARHAARHGIHTLVGDVLVDNRPMITMLERMHCELQQRDDEPGLLLATIRL